jgi:hypothetical protein
MKMPNIHMLNYVRLDKTAYEIAYRCIQLNQCKQIRLSRSVRWTVKKHDLRTECLWRNLSEEIKVDTKAGERNR